jgi:hypothetical protein
MASRHLGPAQVFRLGEEPGPDLRGTTTGEERVDMVAILSVRMRELTGQAHEPLRRDLVAVRRPASS